MANIHHYTGLTDAEVAESRAKNGVNIFTPPKKETLWDTLKQACTHWISYIMYGMIFLSVIAVFVDSSNWIIPPVTVISTILIILVGFFGGFKDPLFKILITAFVLSIGISIYEYKNDTSSLTPFFEPIGIIVALLLATGVAFFLERSNRKSFQSLNEANDDTIVKVIRNNNVSQVARKEIVVGDIVLLETGEEVPADCELLESFNLTMNESSLTGEPQARKTTIAKDFDSSATYPSNHILQGTTIIDGFCTAKVFNVGDNTENGKVYEEAQVEAGDPTPLSEKLDALAGIITKASYVVAGLIIIGRILAYFLYVTEEFDLLHFTTYILNTFMIAVTLIVVAVPEGLPMSVTLSLAFSMRKLMKKNTLPRTLHSCETMGATSVICTDKTGTLTQNLMQVSETTIEPLTPELWGEMIALNSTAHLDHTDKNNTKAIGNPTEGALLMWLDAQGVDYRPIRENIAIENRLPFTTENKYMATAVKSNVLGKRVLYVKGAPEILMSVSNITEQEKNRYINALQMYQSKAMRTLALAYKEIPDDDAIFKDGKLAIDNLHFVGIFSISDPVRSEVPEAIKNCLDAGIMVKIVTGDTSGTAKEIGKQIGLWKDNDNERNIMTGTEFAALSDEELSTRVEDLKILSRARPMNKERLVKLLKGRDLVVAVTGDGTNDAPALNAADVGLSLGDGTAVAKEASDMTIQDNSFSTIAYAVIWGRSLYKNIQRFIMYQMTINVVACLIVLIGAFTGTESPLTVTQMLWVNLIMDTFAAMALASLPPSRTVMQELPRKATDSIINKGMAYNIFGVGGFFTLLLLVVLYKMHHSDVTSVATLLSNRIGEYNGLSEYELSMFFTIFVMLQFWNMFNAKAFMAKKSAFYKIQNCKGFLSIALVIFVGQIVIVELGGKMFNVTHLHPADWITIIIATAAVMVVGEINRLVRK